MHGYGENMSCGDPCSLLFNSPITELSDSLCGSSAHIYYMNNFL